MTKQELIKSVAAKAEFTQKDTDKVIEALVETIKEEVAEKGTVLLGDLVKFSTKEVEAADKRNPKTGEIVPQAAYTKVVAKIMPKYKKL